MNKEDAKRLIDEALAAGRQSLLEPEAKVVVSAWGIQVPGSVLVKGPEDIEKAEMITPPFVLKVVSPDILHKTEVNGVITGIEGKEEIGKALTEMKMHLAQKAPEARIEGFLLEEMAPEGVEVIIGGLNDPQFGPVVMFGIGGIAVELLKDVSFRLAPVDRTEVFDMMKEVKSYPLLTGFRGKKPVDMDELASTIMKLSEIVFEIKEIKELEINPLLVYGNEVIAVDAKVILKSI